MAYLPSSEYAGLQRGSFGAPAPRSATRQASRATARVPELLAPDDESLIPAPSVTGEQHGPGGVAPAPAAARRGFGTPFMGNQPEIDEQAERSIHQRYLLRLADIKAEDALRWSPQQEELKARTVSQQIDALKPAGGSSHIKYSPRAGVPLMDIESEEQPPEAPLVGEVRASRAAAAASAIHPTIRAKQMGIDAETADREELDAERAQFNSDVARMRQDGRPNPEGRIRQARDMFNAYLDSRGVRQSRPAVEELPR